MRKIIGFAAAVMIATAANAVGIVNGSFEDGIDPGSSTALSGGDTASITGWTVEPLGLDYVGTLWAASDGSRSIDLSSTSRGQIFQKLSGLDKHVTYQIGFDLSANPFGGADTKRVIVSATGGGAVLYTYTRSPSQSATDMQWAHYTYRFSATTATPGLQFLSLNQDPYGVALDNVTLAVVPEPSQWALLIAGFGLTGFAARRRRTAQAAA